MTIELTNDNIKEYVMLNGGDKILTSMSEGFYISLLTKENDIIYKKFVNAVRSADKLSVKAEKEITFIPSKTAIVDKVLVLTKDKNFSFELKAITWREEQLMLYVKFNSLKLFRGSGVAIDDLAIGF